MALEKQYTNSRKLVVGVNDLLTWCNNHGELGEKIKSEWLEDKNGSMSDYKAGSTKEVYWKCSMCGEHYKKKIRYRIRGKMHRPCGEKIGLQKLMQYNRRNIPYEMSLAAKNPLLLEEWDYEENLKENHEPQFLSANSAVKVYWICKVCGHKWKAEIRQRRGSKCNCSKCKERKAGVKNEIRQDYRKVT